MAPLSLGIDLGTGAVKALLLTADGEVLATASASLETAHPQPGHDEQDPSDWEAAVWRAVGDLVAARPGVGDRVSVVGVCGAAHIPVLLDESRQVLRPAIMWSDRRSAMEAAELDEEHGGTIATVTLNRPTPTWTLPQLRWLARNEPDVLVRVRHVLFGKDVIVLRLTGELATDAANAASSMLADVRKAGWSPLLVELAGLDADVLPPVFGAQQIVGGLLPDVAAKLGLRPGIPVVAGTLDSIAELLAVGVVRPGQAMLRLGTAGGVMAVSSSMAEQADLITYPFLDRGWASQAFTTSCAGSLRWLQHLLDEGVGPGLGFEDLDGLAGMIAPGAEGLVFHPYLLGERAPHWDPALRGSFTGLAMHHDRSHLARAVMEGIGCSMRDCLEAVIDRGFSVTELRATGGGTRSDVLAGVVSSILGRPLSRMRPEGSALGVAMLAATGGGLFDELDDAVAASVVVTDELWPDEGSAARYDSLLQHYRAVTAAMTPLYHAADPDHRRPKG